MKKDQVKQVLATLRDMDDGREVNLETSVGLKEQVIEAQKNLEAYRVALNTHQQTLTRQERAKKETKENLDQVVKQNEDIKSQIHKLNVKVKEGCDDLTKKQVNPKVEVEKQTELKRLEEQKKQLDDKLEELLRMPTQFGNITGLLNVDYKPPAQNFDRNLVKGRVVRLISAKEDRFAVALEQAAGERLFSIIVENDVVCSLLIKQGSFMKQRATLIPNNKLAEVPIVSE